MKAKNILLVGALLVASYMGLFAQPPDYHPRWERGDSWRVKVTTRVLERDRNVDFPDDGSIALYPYPGYCEYLPDEDAVYEYRVVETGTNYEYRAPMFNPFAARPWKPNIESNWTHVAVLDVTCITNSGLCSNWTLFFETNNVSLLQLSERTAAWGWGQEHELNPYWQESWLTRFAGSKRIIHDFPRIPNGQTNETSVLVYHQSSDNPVTQSVVFAGNVVTQTLERWSINYRMPQKATFVWEKDKKWWSHAKVELGTNVVVSGELIEP